MKIEGVKERVQSIGAMGGDPEASHCAEDELFEDVLKAIRDGAEDPAGLAREALKVLDQNNTRWYS